MKLGIDFKGHSIIDIVYRYYNEYFIKGIILIVLDALFIVEIESTNPANGLIETASAHVPVVTFSNVDERSSNYEAIRYSQFMSCKHSSHELRSSSSGRAKNSCEMGGFRSVVYDNLRNNDQGDYRRLLLRKNRSICAANNNILLEEGEYAYLQTQDTARPKPDFAIRRSKSLSKISGN